MSIAHQARSRYGKLLARRFGIALLLTVFASSSALAQEEEGPTADEEGPTPEEVAKQLANPNATIGFLTFPTDLKFYDGELPDASSQKALRFNFQPSLPYSLGPGMNLFARPLVPVIISQPVPTEDGFENVGLNLGDISLDVALGKSWSSGVVGMVGGFVSAPTATDDNLGTQRWLAGPEFVLGYVGDWGSFYVLLFHSWSISGNEENTLSVTGGQYFYTINLGNAWQIQGQPVFSYNKDAPDGSEWSFPIGGGLSKTTKLGKTNVKFGVQYWYYLATNETFGVKHQIRFLITPVIPLPW